MKLQCKDIIHKDYLLLLMHKENFLSLFNHMSIVVLVITSEYDKSFRMMRNKGKLFAL